MVWYEFNIVNESVIKVGIELLGPVAKNIKMMITPAGQAAECTPLLELFRTPAKVLSSCISINVL